MDRRVEWAGPGALDHVDRALGVGAREQRPHHVIQIGHVDILVDYNGDAAEIGAHARHRRDVAGLPGMAGVALLDGDDVEQAAPTDAEAMCVDDSRNAGGLHLTEQ